MFKKIDEDHVIVATSLVVLTHVTSHNIIVLNENILEEEL